MSIQMRFIALLSMCVLGCVAMSSSVLAYTPTAQEQAFLNHVHQRMTIAGSNDPVALKNIEKRITAVLRSDLLDARGITLFSAVLNSVQNGLASANTQNVQQMLETIFADNNVVVQEVEEVNNEAVLTADLEAKKNALPAIQIPIFQEKYTTMGIPSFVQKNAGEKRIDLGIESVSVVGQDGPWLYVDIVVSVEGSASRYDLPYGMWIVHKNSDGTGTYNQKGDSLVSQKNIVKRLVTFNRGNSNWGSDAITVNRYPVYALGKFDASLFEVGAPGYTDTDTTNNTFTKAW